MNKSKLLMSLVLVIYALFAVFEFVGNENVAFTLNSLILPLIAIVYFAFFREKTLFFTLFLLCYAGSDVIGLVMDNVPDNDTNSFLFELDYYVGNSLYIMAYVFLFIEIARSLNIWHVLKNFLIHLLVLVALNVWLVYVLQSIVDSRITGPTEYLLELTYNVVMLLLLSGSLLNYFYRDNQKALYLFLGALCIVFSEVIDVAYIYISQRSLLNFLSTTLTISAFYFFCKQANYSNKREEEIKVVLD